MRHRTLRAILAIWIAVIAIAGLYIPTVATVPLTASTSDGITFSGIQRSITSGAIDLFEENAIGPFTTSSDPGFVQLSWDKVQQDSFLNCDPGQFIRSLSETIRNRQTNHYSVDLSGTSGQIESLFVGVPTVDNAGIGTTAPFPLDAVTVTLMTVTPLDDAVTVTMAPTTPHAGEAAGYLAMFDSPLAAEGVISFDVTFTGEVDPPLSGTPQTASLGCPPPNDDLEESTDFGLSRIFLRDPYVVVNVAEPINQGADVELVEKKGDRDPVLLGTPLTYTIIVRNNGPDPATGVVFEDDLARSPRNDPRAGVKTVEASSPDGTCDTETDLFFFRVRCEFGTLQPTETVTVVIKVIPGDTGTLRNSFNEFATAEVNANETDPMPGNNNNVRNPTLTQVLNVDRYITAVVGGLVAALQGNASDELNAGQTKALFATLNAARAVFARGDYTAARQQIEAFRTQIETVGGHLPQEQREALKAEADLMLQSMDFQELGS